MPAGRPKITPSWRKERLNIYLEKMHIDGLSNRARILGTSAEKLLAQLARNYIYSHSINHTVETRIGEQQQTLEKANADKEEAKKIVKRSLTEIRKLRGLKK